MRVCPLRLKEKNKPGMPVLSSSICPNGAADLLLRCFAGLKNRETLIDITVRLWNHMRGDNLAHLSCSRGAGIDRSTHSGYVAANNRRDQSGVDLSQPTRRTFAALTIASAASIIATRPMHSTMPSASAINAPYGVE